MKNLIRIITCVMVIFTLTACSKNQNEKPKTNNDNQVETKVTTEEAKKLIDENKELVIIDMRTKEEYDTGHIKNAILIPHDQIEQYNDLITKYKDKPILIYCRTGRRTSLAVSELKNKGFKKIYHMNEGISMWKYETVNE